MEDNFIIYTGLAVIASQTSYLMIKTINEKNTKVKNGGVFLDTSVLIDGRIYGIAKCGFLPADLVVTTSVISELQFLADNGDGEKRERARYGMNIVKKLQSLSGINVQIMQDDKGGREVDDQLVYLSQRYNGVLCTVDYNLIKVAEIKKVGVVNINELAKILRMNYMPSEVVEVFLQSSGQDNHQAVGHLEDGTMVVVEYASRKIGKKVSVEILRSLQTSAGKMCFAKLTDESQVRKTNKSKKQVVKSSLRKTNKTKEKRKMKDFIKEVKNK